MAEELRALPNKGMKLTPRLRHANRLIPLASVPRARSGPQQRSAVVRPAHGGQPRRFPANCPTIAPRASPRTGLFGAVIALSV